MVGNRFYTAVVSCVGICLVLTAGCSKLRRNSYDSSLGGNDMINVDGLSLGTRMGEELPIRPEELMPLEPSTEFEAVLFDFDKAEVRSTETGKIEVIADYLRRHAAVGLIIEGHSDERGSSEYNMALGERRALAVRAYLIGLGVEGARLQTKSYGEERPLDPRYGNDSWRVNRRAEFVPYR